MCVSVCVCVCLPVNSTQSRRCSSHEGWTTVFPAAAPAGVHLGQDSRPVQDPGRAEEGRHAGYQEVLQEVSERMVRRECGGEGM